MRNSFLVKLGISVGAAVVLSTAVGATTAQATTAAAARVDCIYDAEVILSEFGTFDIAAKGGKPDGIISRGDMNAVDQGNYPQILKDAAKTFLNNKSLFDRLDTAAQGGKTDDRISYQDVVAFRARGTCG